MRKSLALLALAATLCGCKTALVYTGSVRTGDNQKAVEVSKVLEEEYFKQGLRSEHFVRPPIKVFYWTSWTKADLCIGNWVNDGNLFIRIVPQPYCNDASRGVGEHMRVFMADHFPDLQWNLVARSELDWFR